jgi:hypothetical protein
LSLSTTKRRLAGLASASAVIATMAVATAPAAAMAVSPTILVNGEQLTAKIVNPTAPVTGTIDATGYDIAVYYGPGHTGTVKADISGATYYAVVADRATVNVTGSKLHDIGDSPLDGMQRGRPVFYYDGARGTVSGSEIYNFQKNGVTISGLGTDGQTPSTVATSVTVMNNVITGEGHIDFIAQNGVVVRNGANAVVRGNIIRGFYYTPTTDTAAGLLNYSAGTIAVAGNTFSGNEINIDGPVKTIRDVQGTATVTTSPHRLRIVLSSEAQPANTVIGNWLHWTVKIDGRGVINMSQPFGKSYTYNRYFTSGSHRVLIYRNGVLIKNVVVRA